MLHRYTYYCINQRIMKLFESPKYNYNTRKSCFTITRMHSSRMRTDRLLTVCLLLQHSGGVQPRGMHPCCSGGGGGCNQGWVHLGLHQGGGGASGGLHQRGCFHAAAGGGGGCILDAPSPCEQNDTRL